MARSRRKPYYKDKGMTTKEYWSKIRREWKQHLHSNYDDPDLYFRNPKSIINDWDYCDHHWYIQEDHENEVKHTIMVWESYGMKYSEDDYSKFTWRELASRK